MHVNTELLRRPTNWITIWSMTILAAFMLHLFLTWAHGEVATFPNTGNAPKPNAPVS